MDIQPYLSVLPVKRWRDPPPVVAVVPLIGLIGQIGPFRRGLTLAAVEDRLERAFALPRVKAVVLRVNSPGGAPVQAALIAGRVRALAAEKAIPVIAVAEDVAASGGYWLLTAGDEIYADASSIVGSIGVISAGFGFADLLERIGVERRVYTAGDHKGALDPFRPAQPDDIQHLRAIQADIHDAFKDQVRARRQGKLNAPDEVLFSGRVWGGGAAVGLGLVDALGDVRTLMRQRFGPRVRLVTIDGRRSWWRRRLGMSVDDAAAALLAAVEERMAWNRFGL